MQYVSCLYTAQGDYVCQKNQNLDAFYNKPIVEGFYNAQAPPPASPSTTPLTPAEVASKKYFDAVKTTCTNAKDMDKCKNNMATLYNSYCSFINKKTAPTCTYTAPPPGTRVGAGVQSCNDDEKKLINDRYNNVATANRVSDIFPGCTAAVGPKPVSK